MKKHDEGYILAYVLVILVVVCMIAVSVLTVPLTNLKVEKAAVEKMQQQYTAQGMIEQALATMVNDMEHVGFGLNSNNLDEVKSYIQKDTGTNRGVLYASKETKIWKSEDIPGDGLYVTSDIVWTTLSGYYSCSFDITAVRGPVMITMGVELQNVIAQSGAAYVIKTPKLVSKTYTISAFTAPAVGGQEGGGQNAA